MKNAFEIRGDTAVIFLKHSGRLVETVIDVEDLEIAQSLPGTWGVQVCNSTGRLYVQAHVKRGKGSYTKALLHRFLMGMPTVRKGEKFVRVDHKLHDTLDNRRNNLRIATPSENMQNRVGATSKSKSGVRGVFFIKATGKWRAQVRLKDNDGYCAHFDEKGDAETSVGQARARLMPYSQEALSKTGY